ncbi:MAG: hypothetical protein A3J38_04885 [Gammaproteobacteria bacterium RIFCSPHIGHO2_12_FULL_45_9]|nr:MAG: hypothetical protein A3J38_04885 [Gammaproteobacteria bacterium RIFCSPHIGHO2_12_FULL_45_9]
MSTLTRADGVQFVVHPYRDSLRPEKKTLLLLQRIRAISEEQGAFVHLFKRDNQEIEAVFSREPGYLLGESVRYYFHQARNLIFCERLEANTLLVVVVQSGTVFLDMTIQPALLKRELAPLTTATEPFQVYLSGDVPFIWEAVEADADDTLFTLPASLILSCERLEKPLFTRLPVLPALQLVSLTPALKSVGLTQNHSLTIGLCIGLCALVAAGALLLPRKTSPTPPPAASITNPYAAFTTAMQSPAPLLQLETALSIVAQYAVLPGWRLQSAEFTPYNAHLVLQPAGSNLQNLQELASANGFTVRWDTDHTNIDGKMVLPNRSEIQDLYPLDALLNHTIGHLQNLLTDDASIQITQTQTHGSAKQATLMITFAHMSPELIGLLGKSLESLPASVELLELKPAGGSFKGSLQLSIWGT